MRFAHGVEQRLVCGDVAGAEADGGVIGDLATDEDAVAFGERFGRLACVVFAEACVDQRADEAGGAELLVEARCGALLDQFFEA